MLTIAALARQGRLFLKPVQNFVTVRSHSNETPRVLITGLLIQYRIYNIDIPYDFQNVSSSLIYAR